MTFEKQLNGDWFSEEPIMWLELELSSVTNASDLNNYVYVMKSPKKPKRVWLESFLIGAYVEMWEG